MKNLEVTTIQQKRREVLIVFDMTADIEANLKLSPTFTGLF